MICGEIAFPLICSPTGPKKVYSGTYAHFSFQSFGELIPLSSSRKSQNHCTQRSIDLGGEELLVITQEQEQSFVILSVLTCLIPRKRTEF